MSRRKIEPIVWGEPSTSTIPPLLPGPSQQVAPQSNPPARKLKQQRAVRGQIGTFRGRGTPRAQGIPRGEGTPRGQGTPQGRGTPRAVAPQGVGLAQPRAPTYPQQQRQQTPQGRGVRGGPRGSRGNRGLRSRRPQPF